ncbi:MAG TPA: aldose epimerase family protein [Caulobacteraceae bacterium]|nr:aldose epimerase family protein [Caulobacteraceae bacterium]
MPRQVFKSISALLATSTAGLMLLAAATPVRAAEARQEVFGQLDGRPVGAVVLTNKAGMKARIIAYGAAIQELDVPDRDGRPADVVLSYPDMTGFLKKPQYFGATAGRYANRIAKGAFILDGQRYTLAINDGENTLHGGKRGFDKVLWSISDVKSGAEASATFNYVSPDGEEGYPGALTVAVTFTLDEHNALSISYRATTTKPTVVNLTNHSYFNLSGAASGRDVLGERLTIAADRYTPVDAGLIPTGELRPVAGTAFDFRTPHAIGSRLHDGAEPQLLIARGYDHNFVLNDGGAAKPKLAMRLEDPASGRVLELLTTEPGLQIYTGNFLDGTVAGKDGYIYRQSDSICLEPQHFPDSPNQPAFPSTRLDPGQTYRQVSVFRFTTIAR